MAETACASGRLAAVLLCVLVVVSRCCAGEPSTVQRGGGVGGGGQLEPSLGRGGGGAAVEPLAPRLSGCGATRAGGGWGEGDGSAALSARLRQLLRDGVWAAGFGIPLTSCEGASEPEVQVGNRGERRC